MSYDHSLIPAHLADDPHAAITDAIARSERGESPTPEATALATAISAANEGRADEDSFLSISPIDGSADCVFVCSPYPHIQTVRDIIVPLAFAAGFAVVDDQDGMVLDPRTAREGTLTTPGHGVIPTITPALVDRFVPTMAVEDYVIVATGDHTYMQSKRLGAQEFILEYRDGSPDKHFGTTVTTADDVAAAIHGWLAGDDTSYRDYAWERIEF